MKTMQCEIEQLVDNVLGSFLAERVQDSWNAIKVEKVNRQHDADDDCWNDDDEEDEEDEDDEFDRYCGGCGFSPDKNEETIFWIVRSIRHKLWNILLEKRNAEPGILNRFSECEVLEREGYTKERIKEMLVDDIFAEILSEVETRIEYLQPIDPAKIFLLVDFIMVQPGLLRLIGFGMFFRKRIEGHLLSLV